MRYRTTAGFDTALAKLPREHRRLFADAVRGHLIPALAAGAHRGEAPWPKRLRIHKIGELIESGRFSLAVAQTFPLAEVAEAQRVSEQGHVRGKLVLLVG